MIVFLLSLTGVSELVFAEGFYNVGAGNSCLVLRSRASSRSSAQQCLKSGSQVQMVKYNPGGYSQVLVNGKPGYMWSKFLTPGTPQKPAQPVQYPVARPAERPVQAPQQPTPGTGSTPGTGATPGSDSPPRPVVASTPDAPAAPGPAPNVRPGSVASPRPGTAGNAGEPTYTSTPAAIDANPDMWKSALSVETEGLLPRGGGYTMGARNWPKLVDNGGKLTLQFPNGKISHCTSATAAGFLKYMADMHNSGKMQLQARHIALLNGPQFERAMNGNTYSMAALSDLLGGRNVMGRGSAANIMNALRWAQPGDVLKFDRSNRTGHSTFFQGIQGDKVCYWTSNGNTRGVGTNCEPISRLVGVSVSRFPNDGKALYAKLDALARPGPEANRMAQLLRSETPPYQSIRNWEQPTARTVASAPDPSQGTR